MFKQFISSQIRKASTEATSAPTLKHFIKYPDYVLATVRTFPSLEPKAILPVNRKFINAPLRRDILWKAIVQEADNSRVGAANPAGRSERGFSRRKILPQKGTGKARAGDANSPLRFNGGRAHARNAPNDYTTELPLKVYSQAIRIALSEKYREGRLFIIGGEKPEDEFESNVTEFTVSDPMAARKFLDKHQLSKNKLLFVVNEPRPNLQKSTEDNEKIDIISREFLEVRDILRSQYTFIEQNALNHLANFYGQDL